MERIVDSNFHFHGCDFLLFLFACVVLEDSKINLLSDRTFHIPVDQSPQKIAYSSCRAIESFVLFFEMSKLKIVLFSFFQESCGF